MPSFTDILKKPLADVEPPKNMPPGTYNWIIQSVPKSDTLKGDKWDVLDFELTCLGPEDDVDRDALATYGPVQGKKQRHRFMFNKEDQNAFDGTTYRLKTFLENVLGISTENKSIAEAMSEVPGHRLKATIRWRPDTRPGSEGRVFDEIGDVAAAD